MPTSKTRSPPGWSRERRISRRAACGKELDGGPLAPVYSKADGKALRLALIHHAVTEAAAGLDPGKGCVGGASMLAGEGLARWFLAEAERVYGMLAETPEESAECTLAALVARKGGSVTPRDLVRANSAKYPTADAAHAALQGLEAAGYGRVEEVPPGPNFVRQAVRFFAGSPPDTTQGTRHNPGGAGWRSGVKHRDSWRFARGGFAARTRTGLCRVCRVAPAKGP